MSTINKTARNRFDTPEVLEAFRGYVARLGGNVRAAHRAMKADYQQGKTVGGVDWRDVWAEHEDLKDVPVPEKVPANMPLPVGWSYHNLQRRYCMAVCADRS